MRHTSSLAGSIACLTLLARSVTAQCLAYGMDFQDGGSYFQNSASTDPFTFVTEFSGCNNDTVYNFLIDPSGTEYPCSDTSLQPLNTPMLSTCPINKNQLVSGEWLIVLASNNDNGDSFAYQVDISLLVGPQSTSTYTPTVTVTSTTSPVITTTDYTSIATKSVTAPTTTVTSAKVTIQKTITYVPPKVTTTVTEVFAIITETIFSLSISKTTATVTASCRLPTRGWPNPICTQLPKLAQGLLTSPPGGKKARDVEVEEFALERRAPDPQPLVVTDTNTADYGTTTYTETDPVYVTVNASTTITNTITPTVVVVIGKTTVYPSTVTLPTPTATKVLFTIPIKTTTVNIVKTVTITTTTRPAASETACRNKGGIFY